MVFNTFINLFPKMINATFLVNASKLLHNVFFKFFKAFKKVIALVTKALLFITRLLITLVDTIILLIIELYQSVKPLIKKFLNFITCKGKPCFVLKGCSSNILSCDNQVEKFSSTTKRKFVDFCVATQNSMINRLEYGVQMRNIYANFSVTMKSYALKKQVEKYFINKTIVGKPFSVKNYVASYDFALSRLRKKCNGVSPACFLVDFFVGTKTLTREFSVNTELESKQLKCSVLEDLKSGKWPTDCLVKRKAIKDYVENIQIQILTYKKEQQLDFITPLIFDVRNRILAVDIVFAEGKNSSYSQVGYSDLTLKADKLILLNQTKLSNLSKLPQCKIVMVEVFKNNGSKKSLGISMPVDKILVCMFLNFLDVIVEEKLKSGVFAYRKGRDARMIVAAVYSELNRAKYLKQMCLCLVEIENCFDNILHNKIIEQYPFPKSYSDLLLRWLTPSVVDENQNFKNLGKIKRGVSQGSTLGQSIVNLMLSNAFPLGVFNKVGKERRQFWVKTFSYVDDIVIISNNASAFYNQIVNLKRNLKKSGLFFNAKETKYFIHIKNKIRFDFLGFEFIVLPLKRLKKSSLLPDMKKLFFFKKKSLSVFGILLRPQPEKIRFIKKRLTTAIRKILHQPRNQIYRSFQHINFILLGWGSYFYFNEGCVYGKRLDNYVFRYLRKILVKKFRYKGLFRPK